MPLSTDQQAQLQQLLAARVSLITGTQVAETEYNGQRTVYSKADMPRLDREIQQLQALQAPRGRTRGALRFRL